MTKKEVQKRVLKNGEPLSLDLFEWDEKTNTFSSDEYYLVLDFLSVSDCTFNTGSDCTFNTDYNCTFNTGYNCTFNTSSYCTFNTSSYCTFNTGSYCTFNTGSDCTFNTGYNCTFNTSSYCTFDTGSDCTFDTGSDCTFKTGSDCTFKTGYKCVVVRRDVYEVIELKGKIKIKLNECGVKGFTVLEEKVETIKIGDKNYNKKEIEKALKNVKSID